MTDWKQVYSMLTKNSKSVKEIADYYKYDSQKMIAIEEMSELTKAIVKYDRLPNYEHLKDMAEEIADVQIMIEQLVYLLGIWNEVEDEKTKKLKRQLERIKNESEQSTV